MFATCRVLFVIALGLGFIGAPTARADEKKPEKPQPAAEPAKPIIIQIDASKLPADLLKQLLQMAEKPKPTGETIKPGTKPAVEPTKPTVKPVKAISLGDAIAIAEKTTQGTVVKAERKTEDSAVQFKIDVLDSKGGKTKLTLDASGKVTNSEKKEGEKDEKDEGKGKKKKDD